MIHRSFAFAPKQLRRRLRSAPIAVAVLLTATFGTVGNVSVFSVANAAETCTAPVTQRIPVIQGNGSATTITGAVTVRGVVVGDYEGASPALRGFYVQDATGDGDGATSDGIFVFNGANTDLVSVGDLVQATGTVGENQGQTQISLATNGLEVCSSGASVAPTDIAFPLASADALEAVEGMLVRVPQTMTVTEHFQLARFGQVTVSANGRLVQPTQRFAATDPQRAALQDVNNRSRLIIDDASQAQNPDPIQFGRAGQPLSATNTLRTGDTVTNTVGVLTFTWGGNAASPNSYRLRPINSLGGVVSFTDGNPRPVAAPAVGGAAKVATFNLLNYFNTFGTTSCSFGVGGAVAECRGAENSIEFERQAAKTVAAIGQLDADVLGVIEMENDGYGDTSALSDLVTRLNSKQGAGTWAFIDADAALGVSNALGTDAIKVGLLYKPASVTPVAGKTFSPTTDTSTFERRPLGQTFISSEGSTFSVVANHFKSKGCAAGSATVDTDQSDGQGCFNGRRTAQASALTSFINTVVVPGAGDPDVLVIGDLNAYAKEDPIRILADAGFVDLVPAFNSDTYSYLFDGQFGTLDYALASSSLRAQITGASDFHINADEPGALDYNTNFKSAGQVASLYAPNEFRTSDHDPLLVGIAAPASLTINDVSIVEGNAGTTPATFTISRSGGGSSLTVQYATQPGTATEGTDFTAATGSVSFAEGDLTKTVTIDVVADTLVEPNETFTVMLSNASNGALIADPTGEATIIDDDVPLPTVDAASVAAIELNRAHTIFVPVRLSSRSAVPVTVTWRTNDGTALAGSDYVSASGTITFAPGRRTKLIEVTVIGDRVRESTEQFTIEIVSADAATPGRNGTVTIIDDDQRRRGRVTDQAGETQNQTNEDRNRDEQAKTKADAEAADTAG